MHFRSTNLGFSCWGAIIPSIILDFSISPTGLLTKVFVVSTFSFRVVDERFTRHGLLTFFYSARSRDWTEAGCIVSCFTLETSSCCSPDRTAVGVFVALLASPPHFCHQVVLRSAPPHVMHRIKMLAESTATAPPLCTAVQATRCAWQVFSFSMPGFFVLMDEVLGAFLPIYESVLVS